MTNKLLSDLCDAIGDTLEKSYGLRERLLNLQLHLACRYVMGTPFECNNPLTEQYVGFLGHLLGVGEIECSVSDNGIAFYWASSSEFPHERLFDGRPVTMEDLSARAQQKGWM